MDTFLTSLDRDIFIFLNRWHSPLVDEFMFATRNLLLWAPLLGLSIFIILNYRKNRKRPHVLISTIILVVFIAVLVVLSNTVLAYFLEPLANRARPVYDEKLMNQLNVGTFSYLTRFDFFAAKACAVLAISVFLIAVAEVPKWLKGCLLFWAVLISYNRIYIGAYYPSNVLLSDLIGVFLGLIAYRYYQYLCKYVLVI